MNKNHLKTFIFTIFSSLLLFSCNNEVNEEATVNTDKSNSPDVVFATISVPETDQSNTRGVGLKGKYWATTQTIRIKFLDDGYDYAKSKVKLFASEWLKYANVNFEYVGKNDVADVKIAFNWRNDRTAWSSIGKDCMLIPQEEASMNLPYVSDNFVNTEDYGAIVLREFGHVLGLAFEHQGVNGNFNWNENSVYTYFIQQGWTEDKIRKDVFTTYSAIRTNYTSFDENSIMLLYFPAHLTLDGRSTQWNTKLSATDINFIKQLYPGKGDNPNPEPEPEIPNPMSIKYIENGQAYNYTAVRIGEYMWMNSNFRAPVQNAQLTQHQINRCVWVYCGDSAYLVTPQQVDQYIGQYYSVDRRESFNGKVYESYKTGEIEKPWGTPGLKDFRQLFAMCGNASESEVRQTLCYKVNEIPIAKQMDHIFYMSGNNTNKYGFNLVYGGMRYHGDIPQVYSPWQDNRREIIIKKTDIESIFNMHLFYAYDGTAMLEDYPSTLKWGKLWWWIPVRWCRRLSDAELGYKLYVNAQMTDIRKLGLNETPPTGYTELGNGYLRGFYVQHVLNNTTPTKTVSQLRDMALSLPDVMYHGAPIIN